MTKTTARKKTAEQLRQKGDSMREYRIKLDKYNITKWEYLELKAFCRQYDDIKRAAADLISLHGQDLSGTARGTAGSAPVETAALRRETLLKDIGQIETAARTAGEGKWFDPLIDSCCRGMAYSDLNPSSMPTSNRQAFFAVRREFFWVLWSLRKFGTHGAMPT